VSPHFATLNAGYGPCLDKSAGSRQSQTNEPATAENAGLRSEMEGGEGKQQRQGSRCLRQIQERLSQKEYELRMK
jgi:hypothetical protein